VTSEQEGEGGEGEGGRRRFGVYSETHKGEDPFPHSRGRGKVGSRAAAEHNASRPRPVVARRGLIRLEHAPKRANAQIAFILAS